LFLFVGALAYADDLMLLVPNPSAMRRLLAICDEYGEEFSIKFNVKKSKWLAVVPRKQQWLKNQLDVCHFQVGGSHIDRVTSFIHLDHTINSDLNDRSDIGTGAVLLLDKLVMYFFTFQDLLLMCAINCSNLIVVVFMAVNFGF